MNKPATYSENVSKQSLICHLIYIFCLFSSFNSFASGEPNAVWKGFYSAESLLDNDDDDRDGSTNLQESIAGTNPLDSKDHLTLTHIDYLTDQTLVRWNSVPGALYELQTRETTQEAEWTTLGETIVGIGGSQWAAIPSAQVSGGSLRITIKPTDLALIVADSPAAEHDTDGDGQSDMNEYFAGSDIFDAASRFEIDTVISGDAVRIRWHSQQGKFYEIKASADLGFTGWQTVGGEIEGTGSNMEVILDTTGSPNHFYQLAASDRDTDGDGLSDWEEYRIGTDPSLLISSLKGAPDLESFENKQVQAITISVLAEESVARRDTGAAGRLVFTRKGPPRPVTVKYTVTGEAIQGTDYESLPGEIHFIYGQMKAEQWVVPIPSKSATQDPIVTINLTASDNYQIAGTGDTSVSIFNRRALSVIDFGATGDGVTDDSLALQAALDALTNSNSHNTLYFPSGTYRVDQTVRDSESQTSLDRILRLGISDLSGRDLLIEGESGSKIYSSVSPIRAHILEARATFRSLVLRNMTLEQSDVPLAIPIHAEPNGSDGLAVIQTDARRVSALIFEDCNFINCHGAIRTHASGYDIRGKLGIFRMERCNVLNPWGANSANSSRIWGGGQQVFLDTWVNRAIYNNNRFDGGSQNSEEPERNPLGSLKDGSHFGSPLELIFTENLVETMGVEAVYQLHNPLMTYTSSAVTLPTVGETASVSVRNLPSTFESGQIISIRGTVAPGTVESISFTVVDFNPSSFQLTFTNNNLNGRKVGGLQFPSLLPIYLQGDNAGTAIIERNVLRGSGSSGIVASASSYIRNNYIEGYSQGILIYGNSRTPLFPGGKGTLIDSNVVLLPDTIVDLGSNSYGIHSWGPDEIIRNNLIFAPTSSRLTGIGSRGENSRIEDNIIVAMNTVRNDYDSVFRSVGVGVGNTSKFARCIRNTTYGLDIGVGPIDKHQAIPHYVIDHRSIDDTLPVDHRGVLEN